MANDTNSMMKGLMDFASRQKKAGATKSSGPSNVFSAEKYQKYENEYANWQQTGRNSSDYSTWGNQRDYDTWKSIRSGKVKSARVGGDIYYMDNDTYSRYDNELNTWKKTGQNSADYGTWGTNDGYQAFRYIRDDQNGYGGLNNLKASLDDELTQAVAEKFRSQWGDKYYYDVSDPEDIVAMNAGQMPAYLRKKYKTSDPIDRWLMEQGLPYGSLFNDMYSEAWGERNERNAKRQQTYEQAYNDMASYINGMNGLRQAMIDGMSFEDALATGNFDALGDYYDSSFGKTNESDSAGEKYYKSKKTKLDPVYDKAYEAMLKGETPDDEFFDNFKESSWRSYLKQKQAWNENSFQDVYDYKAVQDAQQFLNEDTNLNANFNFNNLTPVGKDVWQEAGYRVTNDSTFHPVVIANGDKTKAVVINPVRADGTLIPNDELQEYADSYFGKGLFKKGGEDPDKVIIAEFDSKREASEYAKKAESAVGVLFDAFASQIAQAGAEANQKYEESIENLETALESGDVEQVRSALEVVGLADYAEAELADYQGTKINEINDQIREINQQLKTAKGGEEYEALKAEKKRLVEERDNLQAQFRELNEKQLFQSLLNVDTSEIPPEYQQIIDTAFDERDAATQRIQEIDTILAGLNDRAKGNRNYVDDEIRAMGYDNVYDAIQGLTAEKNDLDFKLRSFERVATETEEDARNRAALTLDEAKAVQGVKAGLDLGIGTDQVLTAKELKGWSNKDRAEYLIFTGQDASVPMSAKKALQDLVQYATPEEIQTLNGLALQDPEQAKSYMASLEDVCKIRRVGKQADTTANFAADNPTLASVASVATNKFAGIEGPGNLIGSVLFGQNSIDAIDNAQMTRLTMGIRQKVSEDIIRANEQNSIFPGKTAGEVWSYLYQIGMSMGDSLTSAPMGNLGLGLMGGSAMSQTLIDQLENGASIRQAYALAAISGTAEILTEKFSLENLVDIATGQAPISFGAWAMNTLKQSGIEASEEFASEVINMIGEALVRGDQSDLGRQVSSYMAEHEGVSQKAATAAVIGQRVLEASLGGALSGGLMGGGGSAINLAVDMVKTPGGMATIKAGRQVSEALDAAGLNAESVFKIESDIMNSGLSENMVNDANMLLDTMRERPEAIATEKGQAQLRGFATFFEEMANAEKVYAAKTNKENQQIANSRESADRRLSGLYQGILDAQENAKTVRKNGDKNAYQKAMEQTADLIKGYKNKAVPQYEEEISLLDAKQEELNAKQEQHEADKQNKTADFLSDTLDKIDEASAETVQEIEQAEIEQAEIEQEAQNIYDSVVNPDAFDITNEEPVDDTASEIARNTVASILNDTERAEALAKSGVNLDTARDAAESAIVQLIKDLGVKKKELTPEVTNEITGLFQDILKGDFVGRVTETIPRRIREAILNSYEVNGYDLKDAGIYTIDDFKKLKALVRKSRLRYHWKKGGAEQREVPPSMRNLARGQGIHFVNDKANTSLDQLYNDISATWPGLLPEAYSSEDQLDALINLLSRNKVTKQKFTLGEWIKSNDAISRGIDDRMVDDTISQMLGDLFVQVMPYLDERYSMEELKNGRNAETQQIPVSAEQTTTGEEEFYSNAIGEIQVPEDERGRNIEPVGERAGTGRLQGYPGESEEGRRVSETIRGFAGEDLSGETVKQWDETARGILARVVDSFNEQSENRGVTSKLKQGDLKEVDPSRLSPQTEYNIRAAEKITGVDETSVFSNDRLQETGLYGVTQNDRSLIADLGGDPMEIFHKVHEDFHRVSRYRDSVDRQMMNFSEDQRNKIFRDYLRAKKLTDDSATYKGHRMSEEFQCDIGGAYGYFIATGGDAKGFNKLNIDSDTAAFFIVETNNELTGSYEFSTDDQVNPQSEPIEDLRAHGIQSNPDGSMDEANEAKFSIQYNDKYMDKADKVNSQNEQDGKDFVDQSVMDTAREQRDQVAEYMTENREALNLPEDIEGNTFVGNASYGLSGELSTVCVRSVIADEFVDAVSEEMGRPLTVEETVFASQDAASYVKNPQCIYCYVAMDRAAYRQFLLEYIHQRDDVIGQAVSGNTFEYATRNKEKNKENPLYMSFLNGRSDTTPMQDRYNSWLRAVQNASELITEADLASDDAMKAAIARNPELAKQIKDANKYAQSASWAKKRLAYRAYNNSILNWTAERIRNLNKAFGLRMYSFSDYSPAFVLENMQMITDAAVKGLKVLAYTKDLDFVKIFAGTGANINISVFGYMQNGIIAEDAMQGAPWAEAQELRAMYPNVGCTFVATNDAMVEWALAQDWIDVVIPFHLVRTGETVAEMMNYLNYTRETSDQKAPGWTKGVDPKEIYPTVHNNNKEQYMKALEEAHLTPRFERFVDNPNYMKLVNETRRSSGSTFPVQPVFNVGAAIESLEKMKKEGGYIQHVGGSVEAMREIASETADRIRNGGVEKFKDFQRRVAEGNRQALNGEMKLSVMPEVDAEYMSAVENGDTDTAEKLVEDAAKNAGYDTRAYHGTENNFTEFDPDRSGYNYSGYSKYGKGLYFSDSKDVAKRFGKNRNVMEVFLNTKNLFDANQDITEGPLLDEFNKWRVAHGFNPRSEESASFIMEMLNEGDSGRSTELLKSLGYNGVIARQSNGSTEYVVFDANQVKSANPVVYDNARNVIPLSERFNPESNDIRFSIMPETDAEYMDAVERGDMATAQRMVNERANAVKAEVFAATDVPAYRIRRGPTPKKTIKVYKTFTLDENGRPSALFVSSKNALPVGVWLDAQDTFHFTDTKNGRQYVPSTKNPNTKGGATGRQTLLQNIGPEDLAELERLGHITRGENGEYTARSLTSLAYRPGWHAGDLPFFPQGGMKIEGSNYENVHRFNQVVFECEMDADEDYTSYDINADGTVKYHDMQRMPENGSYKFATNPMANSQDIGAWYISGSLKINRALTEEETNQILDENGRLPQEWQAFQDPEEYKRIRGKDAKYAYEHTIGPLDLDALGYDPNATDGGKKLLDPVTYDDDGNVIPLSQRFNPDINDPRYSYMPENDEDFASWSYRMQWTREQLDEQYRKMSAEKRAAVIRARQRIETRQSVVKRRENIAKNASELRDWFNTPDVKKGKYIPDFLKDSIMTALSGIDLGSTKRPGGKMVQNWRRSMQDLANNLAQYQLHQNGDNSDARFDGIHLELPSGFVEAFQDLAASIPEDGKNYLQDMNADQLEALDKSISILRSAVRNANRLQANARSQSVAEIGRETVKELGNQKAKKQPQNRIVKFLSDLVNVEMLDAVSYAQRLGNAGGSVINSIINGFLKGTTHVREAQEFFNDALKQEKVSKKDVHRWSNQAVNVTLESGQTIGMTQGQLMNLYALSKRPQALQHLLKGGIELANNKASKNSQNRAYTLTYKDLDNAFSNLTETQKRFVDRLQTYLSETASGWGNEVSQELYGINLYGEENYWPIRSAKSGLATQDPEKVRAFNALMNAGFTKSLQKYASNPIMLDDAVQVFCDHVSQMSNYSGMAIPIADAMKWFNYQNRGEDGSVDWNSSVKRSVAETMGNGGTSYFINLIKDINGLSEGGTGTALPSAIVSNTKRAAVAGKLRVMVQQPTSVVRAMSMINPKYFAGFDDAHLGQVVKEMQDNAPIAWWKSQGNFDIGTGKSMRDIISGDSSGLDSVMNATMAPAGLADDLGWSWIWNACKREQAARNPGLSGQELMDKVVERFTDVINKTQVIDTVVHRSQIMRSKDNMVKQSTAFMSEPIKTFNLLHNAVNDVMTGKPGAKLRFAKTLTAVTASWAVNAAVLALHDSLRDRDEDEDFWEMVKEKFLKEFKSNANQINAIPYLRDVYSLMQGSDVERMELSGISDLISSVQRLYKAIAKGESNYTQYGLYRDLITSAGNILGTPLTGLLNSAEVMINAAAPGTLIRRKTRGWDKAEGLIEQGIDKKQARGLMKNYNSDNTATKAFSILAYDGNRDGAPDFDEEEQNIIAEALGLSYNPEKDGSLTDYAIKAAGNYLKGKQKIMDNENSTDEEYAKAEEAYDKYSQLYDDWFEFLGL